MQRPASCYWLSDLLIEDLRKSLTHYNDNITTMPPSHMLFRYKINISILPVLSSFLVPLSRMYWIKSRYCISSWFCVFTHGGSFITDVQVSEFALCISLTDSIFYDALFFLKNKRKGFSKCLKQNNDFHFLIKEERDLVFLLSYSAP